ncbi:YetF domain-containing protein [Bacillus sp. FJAT-27251]|uniref:DUF421 domain-containing protein n=1 Tax=Bacillus sp. FJAT-27251 TaxID=1684142 RepID=UPI0006A7E59C|nr:YetF domain-containing protein [Bacillus sp. FJAT-27251]
MDFVQGQETLTIMEWILRAVVSYFFIVVVARALGQRAISQLRLLDFVMALIIGNIIAHPLSDEKLGLKGSFITTTVLVALYIISIFIILRWPAVRKLINQTPIKVIENGKILNNGLKKARISIDVLLEELRKDKVADVNKVALALWESEGRISFFLDPKYEPLTPSTCQIDVEPFDFPRIIIKEGRIMEKELQQTHKDLEWVISKLEMAFQTEVKNVLLATLDRKDNLNVFLYK